MNRIQSLVVNPFGPRTPLCDARTIQKAKVETIPEEDDAMSTNSPEEAHEETDIPWPAQMQERSTEDDPGEQPKKDATAEADSNGEAIGV